MGIPLLVYPLAQSVRPWHSKCRPNKRLYATLLPVSVGLRIFLDPEAVIYTETSSARASVRKVYSVDRRRRTMLARDPRNGLLFGTRRRSATRRRNGRFMVIRVVQEQPNHGLTFSITLSLIRYWPPRCRCSHFGKAPVESRSIGLRTCHNASDTLPSLMCSYNKVMGDCACETIGC